MLSVLLVGIDLVGLAISAKELGCRVLAVDYFGDFDLRRVCDRYLSVIKQKSGVSSGWFSKNYDPRALLDLAIRMSEEENIDAILLSSGLDDSFNILEELNKIAPILGNPPDVIRGVRLKKDFFKELERLNVPHPHTVVAMDIDEALTTSEMIGYPLILKPIRGFAGSGIIKVDSDKSLEKSFRFAKSWSEEVLVQEYIEGVPASISFLASNSDSQIITLNEQLLGLKTLYQPEPFGYCGNIVPLDVGADTFSACEEIVSLVSEHFNLRGSNGIDLVISSDGTPYLIEVNPRFQGSLECVEQAIRLNLVNLHIKTCTSNWFPKKIKRTAFYSIRLILFTPLCIISPNLARLTGVRDIPIPGSITEKGEPLCSIIVSGKSREAIWKRGFEMVNSIYNLVL